MAHRGVGQRLLQGQQLVETAIILQSTHLSATHPGAGADTIIPTAEAVEGAGATGVAVAVATTIRIIILARPVVAVHLGSANRRPSYLTHTLAARLVEGRRAVPHTRQVAMGQS